MRVAVDCTIFTHCVCFAFYLYNRRIQVPKKGDFVDLPLSFPWYRLPPMGDKCLTVLTRHWLGYPATFRWLGGGGGVRRPLSNSRTADRSETSATRRSEALDETVLKRPINFQNEITCQVKVRWKVKIGGFRGRRDLKIAVLGQNLLQILLNPSRRNWSSFFLLMFDTKLGSRSRSVQVQVTKGHHTQNTRYIRGVAHLL